MHHDEHVMHDLQRAGHDVVAGDEALRRQVRVQQTQ
jgi:hypothetical protein